MTIYAELWLFQTKEASTELEGQWNILISPQSYLHIARKLSLQRYKSLFFSNKVAVPLELNCHLFSIYSDFSINSHAWKTEGGRRKEEEGRRRRKESIMKHQIFIKLVNIFPSCSVKEIWEAKAIKVDFSSFHSKHTVIWVHYIQRATKIVEAKRSLFPPFYMCACPIFLTMITCSSSE